MQDCVQGPHQLYGCNFFVSLHMPTCKELLEKSLAFFCVRLVSSFGENVHIATLTIGYFVHL